MDFENTTMSCQDSVKDFKKLLFSSSFQKQMETVEPHRVEKDRTLKQTPEIRLIFSAGYTDFNDNKNVCSN